MKEEEAAVVPAPAQVGEGLRNNRRHIPEELVEKILLNLPVNSIFRFSIVSKSWRSMIFAPEFSKSYRGREMVVLRPYRSSEDKAWVCPVSSLTTSSDSPMDSATPFTASIPANSYLHASCGQLWFVESQTSLILCNPSTHACRTLPAPPPQPPIMFPTGPYVYGLGFDSAADDYKVLKILPEVLSTETEVYSLKRNSWKKINSEPPLPTKFISSKGLFADGLLYWLVKLGLFENEKVKKILTFDLHREEYRELELPNRPVEEPKSERPGIAVFGGKLRLYMNYKCKTRFAVWVLEDYESKLWKKELNISYEHMEPLCDYYLKPFYFYDKFCTLVKAVTSSDDMGSVYVSEDGGSTLVAKNCGMDDWQMFDTYVEGFDSPWHEKHEKPSPRRRVESSSALEVTIPLNEGVLRGVLVYEN